MPYEVIHHDNLQSVLGLSGHDGTVLQTISYDPFGNTISTTGSSNNNQLHYTGREQDTDTGLMNYRARIYDPTTGRFCTEDPKGFAAGVNFFVYAADNPINFNDPYGFTWRSDVLGYTSAVLNTAALATVWNPGVAGYLKFGGLLVSGATIANAGYERFVSHEMTDTEFYKTVGTEAVSDFGAVGAKYFGTAATSVEAFVTGITRGVGIADTTVETVKNFGAAYNQTQSTSSGSSGTSNWYNQYVNPATSNTSSTDSNSGSTTAASGGYLIYPNKSNTNMTQSVYKK